MQKYKPIVTGVLTSESQWAGVMGSDYTGGSGYPLWYYKCMTFNEELCHALIINHSLLLGIANMTTNQPLTILRLLVDGKNQ